MTESQNPMNHPLEMKGSPVKTQTYDVAVVGGGAAGLSAALVLGRARRRVAVIDAATLEATLNSYAGEGWRLTEAVPAVNLMTTMTARSPSG